MSDEPAVGEGREKSSTDKWKPALKVGLALIAVWVIIAIFWVIIRVVLSYLRPWWAFWWEFDTGAYPVYTAIYYLLYGGMLLVLAGLLVTKKGWHEALFDELQLTMSRPAMNYFAIGLIVGTFAILAIHLVLTLSSIYLFKGQLYTGLDPEKLAFAILLIVPQLVLSIGLAALIQGYFQRTISKNYGWMAGIMVAAFVFTLLSIFPSLARLLAPQYLANYFITGVIIAYLFHLSKSIYMPIGFSFAWYLFPHIENGFMAVGWIGSVIPTFLGLSINMIEYLLRVSILLLVLALVWHFGHKPQEELDQLKGKLRNAVEFFRYHDE